MITSSPAEGVTVMVSVAALTGFFSFLLGYLVVRRDPASRARQAFLLVSAFLGIWAITAVFALSTVELAVFRRLFLIGSLFQLLHFGAFLHFALAVTDSAPRRYPLVYLVYLPCVLSTTLFWLHEDYVSDFIFVNGAWQLNHQYGSAAFFSMLALWFGYYVPATIVYFQRASVSPTAREKRVFHILGFSVVLLVAVTFIEVVIVPLLFRVPSQGSVLLFKLIWLLCFGYLVDRFHFLTAPPRLEDIALTAFPGYVVVVTDLRRTVYRMNQEAANLFGVASDSQQGEPVDRLFPGGMQLCELIDARTAGGPASISMVLDLGNHESSRGLIDLKASALRDTTGNRIGYLFIGRPVIGAQRSDLIAGITRRETEIIEQILTGRSNAAIADLLSISERTVKTHITHIFDKLGIENRIQLYGLLKDHNFVSRHAADRHLIRPPADP
ncbi:MAG: hypothetical protein EA403_00410 [Spirochaetaceae bacterium]|nr:MAG: hypothetical protein EA403_00410 [Spirochaetaceae bacterium]